MPMAAEVLVASLGGRWLRSLSLTEEVLLTCFHSRPSRLSVSASRRTSLRKAHLSWLKIGPPTAGQVTAPALGEGYMTVTVRAATAYQRSNFWTNLIERNRQAVLTGNLSASIANVPVSQTVTGKAITLQRNNSMVDLGYSGVLVDHLPTTFSGMNVNLQINKTAQDGLQALINQVSALSTSQPPVLTISPATLQITSLAKSVADFLFNAKLLVNLAQTQNPFPSSGALDPGIYVCFAADQASDYGQYLSRPDQLRWNGAQLSFSGQPVSGITFFIIEVDYQSRFFTHPLDALSFGASKPWVTLYLTAENEIPGINTAAQASAAQNDIQSHLSDARTLLFQDYAFINDERDEIAQAVYVKLNTEFQQRLKDIGVSLNSPPSNTTTTQPANAQVAANTPGATPPLVTTPTQPPIRPNLDIQDPAMIEQHMQIIQNFGAGKVMLPTAQP